MLEKLSHIWASNGRLYADSRLLFTWLKACEALLSINYSYYFAGSNPRKVHGTGLKDDGSGRAKVLTDKSKKIKGLNIAGEKTGHVKEQSIADTQSSNTAHNPDLGDSVGILDTRSRVRYSGITEEYVSESYVTVLGNGSLVYEDATDRSRSKVTGVPREISQELEDYLNLAATSAMSPSALEEEHELRIKHLQKQCSEMRNLKTNLIGRGNITDFFFSPKYKFAYCKVPKSGSTFWMQLFMVCITYGL